MERQFKLIRIQDVSGTSGTGFVAVGTCGPEGVQVRFIGPAKLSDGSTRFIDSTISYKTWSDALLIHGHGGKTVLQWSDTGEIVSDWDILNGKAG